MPRGTQVNIGSLIPFAYRAITFYGGPSQGPSARDEICNFLGSGEVTQDVPYNPDMT